LANYADAHTYYLHYPAPLLRVVCTGGTSFILGWGRNIAVWM